MEVKIHPAMKVVSRKPAGSLVPPAGFLLTTCHREMSMYLKHDINLLEDGSVVMTLPR